MLVPHASHSSNTFLKNTTINAGKAERINKGITKRLVKVTHPTGAWKEGTEVKYNKPTRNNE